jgi:hypothetical protein
MLLKLLFAFIVLTIVGVLLPSCSTPQTTTTLQATLDIVEINQEYQQLQIEYDRMVKRFNVAKKAKTLNDQTIIYTSQAIADIKKLKTEIDRIIDNNGLGSVVLSLASLEHVYKQAESSYQKAYKAALSDSRISDEGKADLIELNRQLASLSRRMKRLRQNAADNTRIDISPETKMMLSIAGEIVKTVAINRLSQ